MSVIEAPQEIQAPRTVTESDVLVRAADLLEEFDWFQGNYCPACTGEEGEGSIFRAERFCALGAMIRAEKDLGVYTGFDTGSFHASTMKSLARVIGTEFIAGWNDHPGRTKEEVVAKLREAAEA